MSDHPIRIDRCAVQSRSVLQDPFNALRIDYVTGVSVRFVNEATRPANVVHLSVTYGASSESIVDRGSFRPGVAIDRLYTVFAGLTFGSPEAVCRVTSVDFAD